MLKKKQKKKNYKTRVLSLEEEKRLFAELHNRNSTLALNFIDEETEENIYGIKVEVDEQLNFIDPYQNIVKTDIPESMVHVKVISLPKDYEIENEDYDIRIVYNENHVETIKLKHKKGKVEVTTNAGDAEYEIYDAESNKIIPYVIQDDGNIYIAQINTGEYRLKQINVNSKYELAKDIEFTIEHNETTRIMVHNELKESEEDERNKENDQLEQEDKDTNPKENENKENTQKEVEEEKSNDKVEENKTQSKDEGKNKDEIKDNKNEEQEGKENEIDKEEQKPNLDEDNKDDIKEIEEKLEEKPKETDNNGIKIQEEIKNEETKEEDIEKLPRTGNDYFIIKIIFTNLILFTFCILILKKQTARKI